MINFQVHIHGLSGYLAGVSIAVKQVMPDHVLARSVGKQFSKEMTPEMFQNSPGQDHQSTHSSLCIWAHFHPLGPGSGRGFLLHNVRNWTYRVLGLP